jgi:hypothetical protein
MAAQSSPLAFTTRGANRESSRRFPGKTNGHRGGDTADLRLAPALNLDTEDLYAAVGDLEWRNFEPTPSETDLPAGSNGAHRGNSAVVLADLDALFADKPNPYAGCRGLLASNHGLMAA